MNTPEAPDRVEAQCKAAFMISSTHKQHIESALLADYLLAALQVMHVSNICVITCP
jgi:hypothetical protein